MTAVDGASVHQATRLLPGSQAELVHDLDLKDGKFGRPEVAGLAAQIAGLWLLQRDDETRLARGSELFDELCTYFAKKRRPESAP